MKIFHEPLQQELVEAFAKLVFEEWGEDWFQVLQNDQPELIVGVEEEELCVGGAVFKKSIPEDAAPQHLREAFKTQPYLGYLLVPSFKRNRGFASQWIQHALKTFPDAWLVCDKALESFYSRFGFTTQASFPGEEGEEVLMAARNS